MTEPPQLTLPDKPSIAVLPFANMSGDPEQEYFADGMVEEIITALSRIRWLLVIARNSSFTYKGQGIEVKQVGRELGVRYLLEGSVRKAGGRLRITAQLIDALSGMHLWADRFDGSLEDVFDLQDKIASSVVGVIEPALQGAKSTRSVNRARKDLTTYDLYLRAYAMIFSSTMQIPEALGLLDQAIERDPGYGPALVWSAICYMRLCQDGLSQGRIPRLGRQAPASGSPISLCTMFVPSTIATRSVVSIFGRDGVISSLDGVISMKSLQLLAFVALMSATAMPSLAQEQGRTHPPSTSSGSYGPGFSGPGLTGPGSSGPGYYGPGSYGPGSGASPSPPTPFSYFSSGGSAAGTPAVLSVIPR